MNDLQCGLSMKKLYQRLSDELALKDTLLELWGGKYIEEAPRYVVNTSTKGIYAIRDDGNLELVWSGDCLFGNESKEIYIDELLPSPIPPEPDISTLKKRIKNSKSYLEKISLEKQLNEAYKNKKRGRREI